jgi:hypothetical protein
MGNCLVIIAVRFPLNVYAINKLLGVFFSKHLINLPLLGNRQQIINNPVQNQTGREEKEHYRENDRHVHHHLSLYRVWWGRV